MARHIAGQTLDHRLYHFVLAYSAWERAGGAVRGGRALVPDARSGLHRAAFPRVGLQLDEGIPNQVINIWEFESLADMEPCCAAISNDPEFAKYVAATGGEPPGSTPTPMLALDTVGSFTPTILNRPFGVPHSS
jgi:hypothetical protein